MIELMAFKISYFLMCSKSHELDFGIRLNIKIFIIFIFTIHKAASVLYRKILTANNIKSLK